MNKGILDAICAGSLVFAGTLSSALTTKGYAAWTFNSSSNNLNNVNVVVTGEDSWQFSQYDSGTTIIINENGTADIIDSEGNTIQENVPITYETDAGNQTIIVDGTTETTINILNDGTVEITSINATTTRDWLKSLSYVINGQTLYLPERYTINGEVLEVTKLSSPVEVSGSYVLNYRIVNSIVVPEGYTSLCDYAFYNTYVKDQCSFSLPSTLEYMGSFCFNNSINPSITYASTVADFITLASNSAADWLGTSTSNTTTITCTDGTLQATYRNGKVTLR